MKRSRKLRRIISLILCSFLLGATFVPAVYAASSVVITSVKATKMILKTGKQETRVTISNGGTALNVWARVTVKSEAPYVVNIGRIAAGISTVTVPVTDTNQLLNPGETTNLKLELFDNETCSGSALTTYETDQWERTRHWEFYLSQEMHTDLGYTMYQEDLKPTFSGYLDTVKEYMKNSDERVTDLQKFKYAIESGFMMDAYMDNRNADEIQELLDLIKLDRMTIGAGQFNYTMENFSTEETARAAYYTNRFLVDKLGIEPSTTQRMFDNPAFSKSYVDIAAQAGIKYGIHSMNPDRSPYHEKKLYDLYYMEGMDPGNKLLIFNGKAYSDSYGFGGTHWDSAGSAEKAESNLNSIIDTLESRTGRMRYIYDKFPLPLVPYGDNQKPMEDQIIIANQLNKKWDDAGYAYPKVTVAFPEQFFEDVETEYGDFIPTESGTEENWWNDGWGTTAYESGTNKLAGNLIPVAETAASLASMFTGKKYPYEDLSEAVERNLIYDEHTWGNAAYDNSSQYNNQYEWKRSHAFSAKALSENILDDSLKALASDVATEGKAIYVYNPLNWVRDDVVTITDLSGLPPQFEIKDGNTSIPYKVDDGVLTFVAPSVPALGYKTFTVSAAATKPDFEQKVTTGSNYIENSYYKVTFAADGTISSIIDKTNDNREMVDGASSAKFNQYQYYDDFGIPFGNMGAVFSPDKWKLYTPGEGAGSLEVNATGIGATAKLDTSTFRANSIAQTVTLYNDIPRIDIVNEVVKEPLPSLQSKEEAFYTFPFKTGNDYEIRYDLPIGNVAEGSQVYGTSTDWYTASKWVNVKDKRDDYNMVLAIPNTSLLQFGERRTGSWSFDYKSSKPYIYSYVMNNMWQTNFQGDQPGYADFRYSVSTNHDSGVAGTARFGWEISTPLQATVIAGAQTGTGAAEDSLISVNKDNVQISTIKASEANSDGMIMRFTEIAGKSTGGVTVTLPFNVSSVTETDVIENDKQQVSAGSTFTFDIPAYGTKTFRIRYGTAPGAVTGVQAVSSIKSNRTNLSEQGTVTASSSYSNDYLPQNAVKISDGLDWAAKEEKDAWLNLSWSTPVTVGAITIADRPNGNDNIDHAVLTFSDGTSMTVTGIPQGGKLKEVVLESPKTITSLKINLFGTENTWNVGLSGIEVYAGADPAKIQGTELTWNAMAGALYYEVFRSTDPNFTAGSGNYLATTGDTAWFDPQVTDGMKQPYYYRVRAAAAGAKGAASPAVRQTAGEITDTTAPSAPILGAQTREGTRIDLYWTPVRDNITLSRYEIYRDGEKIAETEDNYITTYRDKTAEPNTTYSYTVKAVDISGNVAESNVASATTFDTLGATLSDLKVSLGVLSPGFDSGNTMYSLDLGNSLSAVNGVRVTATATEDDAVITINGTEVASGSKSALLPVSAEEDIIIKVTTSGASKIYTVTASSDTPVIVPAGASVGNEYSPQSGGQKAEHLIDGSGMSGRTSLTDTHDNDPNAFTMWHTDANPGAGAWAKIDLGTVYPVDQMYVWNMNQQNNTGRGLKNVKIEYSLTGSDGDWTELQPDSGMTFTGGAAGYPFQFAKASGSAGQAATNLNDGGNSPVSFHGAEARYVRITAHPEAGVGSWGDVYFGLSEVRFTYDVDTGSDIQELELAKESAESAIAALTASNDTTAGDIMAAVKSSITNTQMTASWSRQFKLEEATGTAAGSISGTITLRYGDHTAEIDIAKVIQKLSMASGDVNGDGETDASDAVKLRGLINNGGATEEQITAGDLNDDGTLTDEDVTLLLDQLEITLGDVSGDGNINAVDIMSIRKILLGDAVTDGQLAAGDLDGNGKLDALDIMKLRKMLLEQA